MPAPSIARSRTSLAIARGAAHESTANDAAAHHTTSAIASSTTRSELTRSRRSQKSPTAVPGPIDIQSAA